MTPTVPSLSIGMPVFNGARYIRRALESLLNQTYSDFELIVSDNASTDGTIEILREISKGDARVSYSQNESNIGALGNFRRVLQMARGQYFMWAAADDEWDRRWVEVLLSNFRPGTSVSFGTVTNIDDQGGIVRRYADFRYPNSKVARLLKYFWDDDFEGKANLIYGIYERSRLLDAGVPDDYAGIPFVDMHFVFNQLERGSIVTDPAVCLYKRISQVSSIPRKPWSRLATVLGADRETLRYLVAYPRLLHDPIAKGAVYALLPARIAKRLAIGATNGIVALWKRSGLDV